MIVKNNLYRMLKEKSYLVLAVLIIPITIFIAVYVATMAPTDLTIGVIGSESFKDTNGVSFDKLSEDDHSISDLIRGKYDAYIIEKNGTYRVETSKGNGLKKQIESFLKNTQEQKTGSIQKVTIYSTSLNLLSLALMIFSLILYKYYFDERRGINKRIIESTISSSRYVLQHVLTVFITMLIPAVIATLILFPLFEIKLEFAYLFTVSLIVCFSSSFGIVLSSFMKKNQGALLVGTMLTVITSLLSGSLFSIVSNDFIDKLQIILPQKYIGILGQNIDKNANLSISSIIMIAVIVVIFLVISIWKNDKLIRN